MEDRLSITKIQVIVFLEGQKIKSEGRKYVTINGDKFPRINTE
jgi:hypothetical protein